MFINQKKLRNNPIKTIKFGHFHSKNLTARKDKYERCNSIEQRKIIISDVYNS